MSRASARSVRSIAFRTAPTLVLAAASVYALVGVRRMLSERPANQAAAAVLAVRAEPELTPLDLLAAATREGFWVFPGTYWTLRERELDSGIDEKYWRQLAAKCAATESLDPGAQFDHLVNALAQCAESALDVEKGVRVYLMPIGSWTLGAVTREVDGRPHVIGGALAERSSVGPLRTVELFPGAGPANPSPTDPPWRTGESSDALAERWSDAGTMLAEITEMAQGDSAVGAVIRHETPQGAWYQCSLRGTSGRYLLQVDENALRTAD
jgi:hypothetical protein